MHSRGKGTGQQAARRSAGETAEEGAGPGTMVPIRAEGIWRHGPRPARQRTGADGPRRKLARRALDEHTRARPSLDADDPPAWHRASEAKVPEPGAQRRH